MRENECYFVVCRTELNEMFRVLRSVHKPLSVASDNHWCTQLRAPKFPAGKHVTSELP